ncbi:MAG: choice-of-anchor D domain-containing protein [Gammaproteobacteria bacterium]|nr:choice-of-anchor D domain-containing protein [Gammaproteobacteria bacterium]
MVLAVFLSPQFSYAATTVACVEGAEPLDLSFGNVTTGCAINVVGDTDEFRFTANAGDVVRISMGDGQSHSGSIDNRIQLYDPDGAEIGNKVNELNAVLDVTLTTSGTFLILANDSGGDQTHSYGITLECQNIVCGVINLPPVVTNPGPQSSTEGDTISLAITAADGETLTYSATGLPAGLTIDPDSGEIGGVLGFDTAGAYDVSVSVSDDVNDPVTVDFAWAVAEGNQPPMLTTPKAQTDNEGNTVALQIVATDDDSLTFSATGLPPGLAIDPDSGLISGSLDFISAGTYNVTVSVDDAVNPPASTAPFTWTVIDAPPPIPVVNVTDVDFGDVIVGASAFASFEVSNSGAALLVVGDVQSSGSPFSVFPPVSFTVAPAGINQAINLGFAPTSEGDFAGTITLLNNTGSDATTNVTGRGIPGSGTGDIDTLDSVLFSNVEETVSVEQIVTLANTGDGLLTVNNATTSDPAFEVFTTPGDILPFTLNPSETRNLIVRFTPPAGTADTTISAALEIASDDVDEAARTVALSGSVVAAADDPVNNNLLAAQVDSNLITDSTCSSVGGEVQFSSDSSSADNFKIVLAHQNGETVESAFFGAIEGAGVAAFSDIDACGLQDGVIEVLAVLDKAGVLLPAFTGTPAVKNTSLLNPPVLGVVPVFSLASSVEICGTSSIDTTVRIEGGSSVVSVKLDSASTDFCLDVPLRRNTQNTLIASAIDDLAPRNVATAQPVQIVQVDLADIVVASAFSRPLSVDEIDSLVDEGVIDLNEAENFNVSMFTVVLIIGSFPVTISQPVVVNPSSGTVSYGRFRSGAGGGWSGGGAASPTSPRSGGCVNGCSQIVIIRPPTGPAIPGVIIIDGRIKTLKEFFQVGLALFNTSPIFNLGDMNASIDVPGGLTPIRAGIGLDVNHINLDGEVDSVLIGDIGPGETGIAQFLIRGDGIGTHRINVDFDGVINGSSLPVDIPVSGSARTTVEVLGPPELRVEVSFPSNPSGPDISLGQVYTLTVDVTNESDRPALYTSLELFVGGDALLVDENGNPIPDSSKITDFGTIQPNQTQSVSFRVRSLAEGEIIACQAVASENIILTIDTGSDCNILNTLPANFVPLPPEAPPTVIAINPLNGEPNIPLTSSVFATFTPQAACIVADTWTNVVTANIDPNNPNKGVMVISADLVEAGSFYLEVLDWTGSPVKHVPTDLTVVDPPAGGTTIAVLRLGLDDPHPNSQHFLRSDTAYRATIIGGPGGVCSAVSGLEMNTTFSWTFTTLGTCNVLEPPSVTMLDPTHGSIDRPLDQQILLEFTNRNKDTGIDFPATMDTNSFVFDTENFDASSFGVYANAVETNGDINGGTAVAGAFEFDASGSTLTFTPEPGALLAGDIIHVRLTDRLNDVCANPVQTPPLGVKLFKFDVISADLPKQTIFDLAARAKSTKINVVWAPVEGVEAYNIYRSTTAGGPYSLIAEGQVTNYAVYADFGLTNAVTYFYVVRSVSNGVESLDSNQASATPSARRRRR